MKKSSVYFPGFFIFLSLNIQAQTEIAIHYYRPYQYDIAKNTVKAWIEPKDLGQDFTISMDGETINYTEADSGRVALLLPLAGKERDMRFVLSTGGVSTDTVKQQFSPLIPADWGYFGSGTISIICSSHQDIAWMNTPDSCRDERIEKIVVPALDMIDKNPAFKFEMEQTLNLMEVLQARPGEKERILQAYKNGNFSWGATFNQPYEGLESGEQLIRQVYLGRKWIRRNMPGMDALVAYNVDVPGRTLQLPQILSDAGIKYLFVSRMKEGFAWWYSPDGSRILTYSPGNYGWALLVYRYFEEDVITAMQKLHKVLENWNDYYESRNLPPNYAVVISTDAGGPKDYSRIIGEWNEIAGKTGLAIPRLKHSTAEEFLGSMDVPGIKPDSISGERPDLWLYIHGPAHYEAIKAKKSAAVSLPAAEIFNSIDGMVKGSLNGYPVAELNKGWYSSIYPDHGWGGKHGEMTDSIFRASLEEGDSAGKAMTSRALGELSSEIRLRNPGSIIVWNDLSWSRSGIVTIELKGRKGDEWIVTDASGKQVPSFVMNVGSVKSLSFQATDVPSLGYKTFTLRKGTGIISPEIKAGTNFCENRFYRVELGDGGIVSLYDRELGREVFNTTKYSGGDMISLGYDGNGAGEFVQVKPVNYDGSETLGGRKCTWELLSNSPVCAVFSAQYFVRNFSVKQVITVYHNIKKIDFDYEIPDWPGEHNRQLRVAFPMKMENAQVTYDVPMGILNAGIDEMKNLPLGWSWEGTYRQPPSEIRPREIENFISASDNEFGVTVSTNLAVADWIDPGRESVSYPVLQGILLSSHKSCHYLGNWYHQKGSHHFRFSLTSHLPGWKNGYQFGVEGNHPLYPVVKGKIQSGTLPDELSFFSVSSPFVRITALKKSETSNSLILRMAEMGGTDTNVLLNMYYPAKALYRTSLIEEDPVSTGQKGNTLNIGIGKNAIETFRLDF